MITESRWSNQGMHLRPCKQDSRSFLQHGISSTACRDGGNSSLQGNEGGIAPRTGYINVRPQSFVFVSSSFSSPVLFYDGFVQTV